MKQPGLDIANNPPVVFGAVTRMGKRTASERRDWLNTRFHFQGESTKVVSCCFVFLMKVCGDMKRGSGDSYCFLRRPKCAETWNGVRAVVQWPLVKNWCQCKLSWKNVSKIIAIMTLLTYNNWFLLYFDSWWYQRGHWWPVLTPKYFCDPLRMRFQQRCTATCKNETELSCPTRQHKIK